MLNKLLDTLNKAEEPKSGLTFFFMLPITFFYLLFKKKPTYLFYTSEDKYFTITEELRKKDVKVVYYYSTGLFGIEEFTTTYIFNLNGNLIEYSNTLGDIISYRDKPKLVLTKPRILNGNGVMTLEQKI